MSKIRDKAKEDIQQTLDTAITVDDDGNIIPKVDQILAHPNVAIVDREAKLPLCCQFCTKVGLYNWVKEIKE